MNGRWPEIGGPGQKAAGDGTINVRFLFCTHVLNGVTEYRKQAEITPYRASPWIFPDPCSDSAASNQSLSGI